MVKRPSKKDLKKKQEIEKVLVKFNQRMAGLEKMRDAIIADFKLDLQKKQIEELKKTINHE